MGYQFACNAGIRGVHSGQPNAHPHLPDPQFWLDSEANTSNVQVCFGVVMAGDIVFDAYVFYLVPEGAFVKAAAITQAASRLGYVAAAESGEVMIALWQASLTSLFWVSLAAIVGGTAFTLALPGKPRASQVRRCVTPPGRTYLRR